MSKKTLTQRMNEVEARLQELAAQPQDTTSEDVSEALSLLTMDVTCDVRFACVGHDHAPISPKPGDVGYDLCAPQDVWLPHGCRREVDMKVVVETPEPLFVLLTPRSSFGTKYAKSVRICNTVGVIDPRYCGREDTMSVWLERSQPKMEFVGRLALDAPLGHKPLSAQCFDAFGTPMDAGSTRHVKVSEEGYGVYDVFTAVEEPDLLYAAGEKMVQMLFLPAARPSLIRVTQDLLRETSRGGYGSTGK